MAGAAADEVAAADAAEADAGTAVTGALPDTEGMPATQYMFKVKVMYQCIMCSKAKSAIASDIAVRQVSAMIFLMVMILYVMYHR